MKEKQETQFLVLVNLEHAGTPRAPQALDEDTLPTVLMAQSAAEAAQKAMLYLVDESNLDEDDYNLTVVDFAGNSVATFIATRAGYSIVRQETGLKPLNEDED